MIKYKRTDVTVIEIKNDKIIGIDEYWGEDEEVPEWRKKLKIRKNIQ